MAKFDGVWPGFQAWAGGGGGGRHYWHWAVTSYMKQSVPCEANSLSSNQEIFSAIYGTPKSFTVFTKARHLSLSWARWIQSTVSHRIFLRSILILPSHIGLGFHNGIFPSGFPNKILYSILISLGEERKLWSSWQWGADEIRLALIEIVVAP
jgi:hypothetical protein